MGKNTKKKKTHIQKQIERTKAKKENDILKYGAERVNGKKEEEKYE